MSKHETPARLGTERTHNRKKLDRLTRDSLAAEAAGMSYGQYKAQHPHTYMAPNPDEDGDTENGNRYERTCGFCGKVLYNHDPAHPRKYCSDRCAYEAYKKRAREKRAQLKAQAQEEKEATNG